MIDEAMHAIGATDIRDIQPFDDMPGRVVVQAPLLKGTHGYEPKEMTRRFLKAIVSIRHVYPNYEWVLQSRIDVSGDRSQNGHLAIFQPDVIANIDVSDLDTIDPKEMADTWNMRASILNLVAREDVYG